MRPNYTQTTVLNTTGLVSIDMVRNHLRLFGDVSMDAVLTPLISVATHRIEKFTGRLYSGRTIIDYYGESSRRLELSQQGATSITSLRFFNDAGTQVTVPNTDYFVDTTSRFPAIVITGENVFAELNSERENPISITYPVTAVSGALISPDIQHAALLMIGDWFRNPENSTNETLRAIPLGAERLLQPYRRY